jgi:hypothetical protein
MDVIDDLDVATDVATAGHGYLSAESILSSWRDETITHTQGDGQELWSSPGFVDT